MKKTYAVVNKLMTDSLEAGIVPWKVPWSSLEKPRNLITLNRYASLNSLLLSIANRESPYWLTFNQAKEEGHVNPGASGTPVIFWKEEEIKPENFPSFDDYEQYVLSGKNFHKVGYIYWLFNSEDCNLKEEIIPRYGPDPEIKPHNRADYLIEKYQENGGPRIKTDSGTNRVSYNPETDTIRVPDISHFSNWENYYRQVFHTLIHSTKIETRMNREEDYYTEELVAEIGTGFLINEVSLRPSTRTSKAYRKVWIKKLKENPTMIFKASSLAQKAADLVLDMDQKSIFYHK